MAASNSNLKLCDPPDTDPEAEVIGWSWSCFATTADPRLIDEVLDMIFQYFDGDRDNLCSFRLVCTAWNIAAARRVKKTLRWKIKSSSKVMADTPSRRGETDFLAVMDNSKNDLFQNFHLGHFRRSVGTLLCPPLFWNGFGPLIVNLYLYCGNLRYALKCLEYTPNLEHLQLYGYPSAASIKALLKSSDRRTKLRLQKLSTLSLPSDEAISTAGTIDRCEAVTKAFISLVRESPRLIALECKSSAFASDLLTLLRQAAQMPPLVGININSNAAAATLARLTSLKIGHSEDKASGIMFQATTTQDINNISELCRGLRVLSLQFFHEYYDEDLKRAVFGLISGMHLQLEELCVLWKKSDFALFGVIWELPITHSLLLPDGCTFPDSPDLKKLMLTNGSLYNYNFLAPALRHFEASPHLLEVQPGLPWPTPFLNVAVLRLADNQKINETNIMFLAKTFPNTREFQCTLQNDEALSAIFAHMPQLRRLYLGKSTITDVGVTGLYRHTLDFIESGCNHGWPLDGQFAAKVAEAEMKRVVTGPPGRGRHIGEIKFLEHFTLDVPTLSRLSVYLGFVQLKELKYLKLKPFHKFPKSGDERLLKENQNQNGNGITIETVPAKTLVDHCPVLAKLDVCGTEKEQNHTSWIDGWPCPDKAKITGCGLTDDVITHIRAKLPFLELVYDEIESLSTRIQVGKAGYVRIIE